MGALARLHAPAKFSHTKGPEGAGGDERGRRQDIKGAAAPPRSHPPRYRGVPAADCASHARVSIPSLVPAHCARGVLLGTLVPPSPRSAPLKFRRVRPAALTAGARPDPGFPSLVAPHPAPVVPRGWALRAGRWEVVDMRTPSTLKGNKNQPNKKQKGTNSKTPTPAQTTGKKAKMQNCPK